MSTSDKQPARSPEDLEARQEARRLALISDVDELAARLAPASLKRSALESADSAVSALRARGQELGAQARQRAQDLGAQARQRAQGLLPSGHSQPRADGGGPGDQGAAAQAYGIHPEPVVEEGLPIGQRLSRLLDDARDGDPVALAIVTGVIAGLAGLSGAALIKAIVSLRSGGAGS